MSQVDEKGHEGNTPAVTAYLCWRKHGQRNSRTGFPAGYFEVLLFTLDLYHTRTAIIIISFALRQSIVHDLVRHKSNIL